MQRLAISGGAAVVGLMLMAADPAPPTPAAPRSTPPLPVAPIRPEAMQPYLARITISGDPRTSGVFETCEDPAGRLKAAQERAKARPTDAPPPLTGCATANKIQSDGVIHHEMSCDRAKGAKTSFRLVSDGTPNDLHMHIERHDIDPVTRASKTTVSDSHMVRLGPCPANLKPGQTRRTGGPIIDKGAAAQLLESARGAVF